MERVLIGMSGGVDSSAAVSILQNQGYEVVGVTFQFIENFDPTDAIKVAKKLGIEHHVADYRKEFKEIVIDSFMKDYENGLTPNPCVLCNRTCKFKFLIEEANKYNCQKIATGHYAKIEDGKIFKSADKAKDQSYFLCRLPKEWISRILFPLEGLTKDKVRKIAEEVGLENSQKKDSFDVCFINDSFRSYMMENSNQKKGAVINIDTNQIIGHHEGLMNYTIGQRKGLAIGGTEDKMYVVGKDIDKNILYIALGDQNEALISTSCLVDQVNYLEEEKVKTCMARFRYRQQEIPVELEWIGEEQVIVHYPQGVKSVTPGQTCVFYQGEECLGGGTIREVQKDGKKLWYL